MIKKPNKVESEKKHKRVVRILKKELPECKIKYNSSAGHDVKIDYHGHVTTIEIKTCERIVCNGIDHPKTQAEGHRMIFNIHRLGRVKFDNRKIYPYAWSQHLDLILANGWYIIYIGGERGAYLLFGIKSKELPINTVKQSRQQLSWGRISELCYPDWLERLKIEVYKK